MKVALYPRVVCKEPSSLILGSFESFHKGHLKLLAASRKSNLKTVIMLVKNPEDLPNASPEIYLTFEERLRTAANLKIDYALVVDYKPQVALKRGRDFLREITKLTNAKEIVVGKDFGMGKNRDLLANDVQRVYPNTKVVGFYKVNNAKLSTSFLKELVSVGDFETITRLSAFPYAKMLLVSNKCVLDWKGSIIPPSGVYACFTIYKGYKYFSYLHIKQNQESVLNVPNLEFRHSQNEIILEIHKQIKVITREREDRVFDLDINEIKLFLSKF